jgi:fatty acid omega-hydroxylase
MYLYNYPIFQVGPRVCIGKEMTFLQMKRVVAGIMGQFWVVPTMVEVVEPEYTAYLTSLMKGGFPLTIEKRSHKYE